MAVSRTPGRIVCFAILLAGVALLCLAFLLSPLHTTPEYTVADYDELARIVSGRCILPEKDALPDAGCSCLVYIRSRFSNEVVGYLLGFTPSNGCAKSVTVSCKALGALPEGQRSITPSEACGEVGLAAGREHLCFILEGCRYDIHGVDAADGFVQTARSLAQSIIGARE